MSVPRFLLRRLLLALPTLFGICLITFSLIHLAPGDPVVSAVEDPGALISRQELASARRLFFLDLPLFYNAAPHGLETRLERLEADLRSASGEGREAVARARRCGTVCLPGLIAARERGDGARRARRSAVVAGILDDHPDLAPAHLAPGDRRRRALARLAAGELEALAGALGRDPAAADRLIQRGTAALPAAMRVMREGDPPGQQAASEVVSALTGIEGRLGRSGPEARRILATWSEWWFQHRRDFVTFSAAERLHGRVTETQFGKWLGRLLTLRFGTSITDGRPVSEKLGEALPVTLLLSFLSLLLAYLIAIPLGVHAAVRAGSLVERTVTVLLFVLYSLPSFWVAMMLILLFGGVGLLDWFPIYGLSSPGMEQASGWSWLVDRLHHLVLPITCLTYGSLAVLSRYQRSAMLEVLRQDYIRTARAKGLSERTVIFKHALRNALLPTITLLGLQVPYLISGSVIIERIFNVPGMGLLTFQAFLARDYPVIMAVSVLAAVLTLIGLILADCCYAVADPRISLAGKR